MMIQLTLISMSIPAILPIRNEPGMAILLFMKVDVVSDLVFLFARAVCGYPLILQLELGFCSSQSPFVMIRLSNGLMVTPKERPGKGLGVCDRLLPDQGPDQA